MKLEKKEPERIKECIRREMISRRSALAPKIVSELSAKICARILASEQYRRSEIILIYCAVRGEAELFEIARQAKADNKKIAYPKCRPDGSMDALIPTKNDDVCGDTFTGDVFIKGKFGIYEPKESKSYRSAPEEIDFVICPLSAFDSRGVRLGMGGGYYDRFLPKCGNATIAAAAYEMQRVDSLPSEAHDVIMDVVFTETNSYYS